MVRTDGTPLSVQHLEALCRWCLFMSKRMFDNSGWMGLHPEKPMKKEVVLGRISRVDFETFNVGFDHWKGTVDAGWIKAQC